MASTIENGSFSYARTPLRVCGLSLVSLSFQTLGKYLLKPLIRLCVTFADSSL